MIRITLDLGKPRTYQAVDITMRLSLDAYALYREYGEANGDYNGALITRCLCFICECFGGAFTPDELLDGYRGSAYILIPGFLREVVGYVEERVVNFPEPVTAPETKTETKKSPKRTKD